MLFASIQTTVDRLMCFPIEHIILSTVVFIFIIFDSIASITMCKAYCHWQRIGPNHPSALFDIEKQQR